MQLSEEQQEAFDTAVKAMQTLGWTHPISALRSILRAQADARPVAWLIDFPDEPELGHYFGEEPNQLARSTPLYTHPEASAPGLSDDAKDLLSAMGFRLVDDFYLRGDVPDDSEESWEVVHRDTVAALSAGAAQLDDDAVYTVLRNYDADMTRKTAEAIAHDLRLTRASAATVAEPSECKRCGGVGTFLGNADGYDDETCDTCCGTGKQQAKHSNKAFKVVTWRSATDREFATRDEALAYIRSNAPNDWHIEPNQAAQQQAEPCPESAMCPACYYGEPMESCIGKQAEPGADERAAFELPDLPEPLEIDWPTLNAHALGCGVEDRGLYDRYDCANYGFEDGVDQAASRVPNQIFDADQMREYAYAAIAAWQARAAQSGQPAGVASKDTKRLDAMELGVDVQRVRNPNGWRSRYMYGAWLKQDFESLREAIDAAAPTQQPSTDQS